LQAAETAWATWKTFSFVIPGYKVKVTSLAAISRDEVLVRFFEDLPRFGSRDVFAVFQFDYSVGQKPQVSMGIFYWRLTARHGCNLCSLVSINFIGPPKRG
jgi:hypothetical protein